MWIQQGNTRIQDSTQFQQWLAPVGMTWDRWPVEGLSPELCYRASMDKTCHPEILEYFKPQLDDIKARQGYLSEDIVSLSADTPNLDGILEMFVKEHHHSDDEVRVILSGAGIFGIVPPEGDPFEIHVEAGDLLIVPAMTRHWFTLTETKQVVALRIFTTAAGWTAIYERPLLENV